MDTATCKNCGRKCHCGERVSINVNAHEVGIYEINVCEECRCKKHTEEKDPNNEL